jgi:Flp pilus assembly protein TadD
VYAVINSGTYNLEYDEVTRTASETFRQQRGNCLSFSNMFVALARHVGLDVQYQEVDIPPDWTLREDVFVLNRHVNVLVDLGPSGQQVVDFNVDDFKTTYDRRAIKDSRALAHHHNNLGVEAMQAGRTAEAVAYFRKAIVDNDRRFSPAWTNLGSLYLREGHPELAEAAFLHALDTDSNDYVAMSNLVRFYDASGDQELAEEYRRRVKAHRMRNPYYRYRLAREAFYAKDFKSAISHLRYAIRRKSQEDQFMFLLGLCYLMKGESEHARRWMEKAEEVASNEALKRNYSSKIEALLRSAE